MAQLQSSSSKTLLAVSFLLALPLAVRGQTPIDSPARPIDLDTRANRSIEERMVVPSILRLRPAPESSNLVYGTGNDVTATTGTSDASSSFFVNSPSMTLFRVRSDGNVGIGSANPAYALDMVGNTNGILRFRMYNQSSGPLAYTSINLSNDISNVAALFITGSNSSNNAYGGANAVVLDNTSNNAPLAFATQDVVRMNIRGDGRVQVGVVDASPVGANDKFVVYGDATVTGKIGATYQDVAEWVPAEEPLSAGNVVVVSPGARNTVSLSNRAYDTRVAGVVSAEPGIILGIESPSKAKIATTGRVKVRVDATTHSIAAGDLLVTSDKPGVAMRSEPIDIGGRKIHQPGTIIGKALEPLESGGGEILVLLSLQ